MYPTEYLPLQTIGKNTGDNHGGFCRWWYTTIENILVFPEVDPLTQRLISEPELKPGSVWSGPVRVDDRQTGWEQKMAVSKAGPYFKNVVQGAIDGNSITSHINLGNLINHEFIIIGKVRSGGFYIVLGNEEGGLQFSFDTISGNGAMDAAGSKLAFAGDSINNAPVLEEFSFDNGTGLGSEAPGIFESQFESQFE
jgi:hypothetical protein